MAAGRLVRRLLAGALVAGAASGSAAAVSPALPPGLPAPTREQLQAVTARAAVSTSVVGESFVARAGLFEFLLDHPQLAADIARTLRFGRYRIWRSGGELLLDDGWGARGSFAVVHAAPGTRVVYARGLYETGWLPDIHGRAVVAIEYAVTPAGDGRSVVTPRVTAFLRLDTGFADAMARMAGAVAQRQADKKARRLARTFAKTTRAIESDPAGIYGALTSAATAPAEEVDAFRRLLGLAPGAGPTSPD